MINHSNSYAFTLLEAILTLLIITVISALAIPNLQQLIRKNKQDSMIYELKNALAITRSTAIKHQKNTYLCILNSAQNGCRKKEIINNLAFGWLIYYDCNDNKQYDSEKVCDTDNNGTFDSNEQILQHKPLPNSFVLNLKSRQQILFRPNGQSNAYGIELLFNKQLIQKINIARTGRVQVKIKHN